MLSKNPRRCNASQLTGPALRIFRPRFFDQFAEFARFAVRGDLFVPAGILKFVELLPQNGEFFRLQAADAGFDSFNFAHGCSFRLFYMSYQFKGIFGESGRVVNPPKKSMGLIIPKLVYNQSGLDIQT